MRVIELPHASTNIYQIELTNYCNATCSYCPHSTHHRARGYMTFDVFQATLDAMANRIVALHHFGEPLLHARVVDFVRKATCAGVVAGFSTNGKLLSQSLLDRLLDAGLGWLRVHTDPFGVRKSAFSVPNGFEFTEHSIEATNDAPVKPKVSFSGHLDIPKTRNHSRCSFLRNDWRVVLWDGTLAKCCHDIEGTNSDALCETCNGYVFVNPRDWCNYDGTAPDA